MSVKGLTYQRLKRHCDANNETCSGFVENLIAEKLGEPTDEDRRKFGEAMRVREKPVEAEKAEPTNDFDETYTPPIKLF